MQRCIRPARRVLAIGSVALTVGGGMVACSGSSGPDTAGSNVKRGALSVDQICEKGKEEGQLILWNQGDPSIDRRIHAAFAKSHPGIQVTEAYVQPINQVQKLTAAHQVGRPPEADALATTPDYGQRLDQAGLIDQSFNWKKLGVKPSRVAYHMMRTNRQFIGLAYNTNLAKESELPATWAGMVDPRWKGRIVVDPRGDQLQLLSLADGKEKVVTYVKKLMEVDSPVVIRGGTAGLLTVASGENILETNGSSSNVLLQQSKGAPVAIHYFDVIPASDFYFAIPKGAAHPYAAACFGLWEGTPEGEAAMMKYEYEGNRDVPKNAPAGSQVVSVKSAKDAKLVAETAKAISEVITSG